MQTKAPADPILKRFRAAVDQIYGDRVARVVLFGSRARGDAQPESDYDVAVFLRDMPDRFAEMHRLADVSTAILYDTGEVVNALPYRADTYNDPRMPLMHEIRHEGVDL
ncbi:MAG TPA: nucleotidyltransferase domain-containing protein [Methylocella sp.]|jgi:predicted nucleotidyltransferase